MTVTARIIATFQVKAAGTTGELEGWASVFGNRDSHGDHVQPGAFRKSIDTAMRGGKGMPMLWQHNSADPVGVWHTVREDGKGLYVAGKMLGIETDIGRYRYEQVKGGAVNGLSIGYSDSVRNKRKDGAYDLVDLKLWEASLVTFPSNARTLLTGVKRGADDFKNPRFVERILCDAGCSQRRAKAITLYGVKATENECDARVRVDLAELIRSASTRIGATHAYGHHLSGGTGSRRA